MIFVLGIVCANAQSFQQKNDFLLEITHYNPGTRNLDGGAYLKAYAQYALELPPLTGKGPLEANLAFLVAKENYSVFGGLSHESHSYFNNHCFSVGYNYFFRGLGDGNHTISLGGRAVLGFNNVDLSKMAYGYTGKYMLCTPDLDLGVEYHYRFIRLGASVKNVFSMSTKYEGVEFVKWPRGYFLYLISDFDIVKDKFKLMPFIQLGFNQGVAFSIGTDVNLYKKYRLNYSFRGPDLHHNLNVGFDIASRVFLNAGYSFSSLHKYSYANLSLIVKIKRF